MSALTYSQAQGLISAAFAAARAKGMTDAMYADLLRVVSTAARTNQMVNGMQVPVDKAFDLE